MLRHMRHDLRPDGRVGKEPQTAQSDTAGSVAIDGANALAHRVVALVDVDVVPVMPLASGLAQKRRGGADLLGA